MKIAYFDCFSGVSGDMLLASLFDAGLNIELWKDEMGKLFLCEEPEYIVEKVTRGGISATSFEVVEKEKTHLERKLSDILSVLEKSGLDDQTKERASNIFRRLASCEAEIHRTDISEVHFHELSGLDTIVDVVGCLTAIKLLGVEHVIASPINVGSGFVECAHGVLPVPAPATAKLLTGYPVYSRFEGELTTPTGALLITEIASSFGEMPQMVIDSIGCGGGRELEGHPNVLRVFIGQAVEQAGADSNDVVYHISTNIDDMDPRVIGWLLEKEMEEGALDVYIEPVYMKKNRPGNVINVICNSDFVERAIELILTETTTLGVRIVPVQRFCLERRFEKVATEYGEVNVKLVVSGGKVMRANPEYEDCARIARESGVPIIKIIEESKKIADAIFVNNLENK